MAHSISEHGQEPHPAQYDGTWESIHILRSRRSYIRIEKRLEAAINPVTGHRDILHMIPMMDD
jgi:hypothetical protein